ncbi:hypothetical protein [Enterovibrio norvegicus]|uniref:hypothetical protein n=1 Tax=Enterovibrio norvegicus TaxID=188144 RepID=UPI000C866B75|nr:hypothetical protein [Enterovibrio norvegicus]PMN73169.1 hypothetical protein BCT27_12560 [Enterovibrio norvegicus]
MPMNTVLDRFTEWKGRLIAYGGGGGVYVYSSDSVATVQHAPQAAQQATDILHYYIIPGVTVGSTLSILGITAVIVRLVFDIWKYFDERPYRKKKAAAE